MMQFSVGNFAKLVLALLPLVVLFFPAPASAHASILNLGDDIDGMTLTNGAADARPLWVFCATKESDQVTTANCRVPQVSSLAIGHVFLATDSAFQKAEWSELSWELSIDNREIHLDQFDTYDYVLPTMAPNPSLVREVFMKFTAWDVVLADLQPGAHTLRGKVYSDTEEYRWIVNLLIEGRSASE